MLLGDASSLIQGEHFGEVGLFARFGGIYTTKHYIPALGRDDKDFLPLGAAILTRLLHCGIQCVVSRD